MLRTLAAVAALAAATAALPAQAAAPAPALRLADQDPVTLRGVGFRANERVRLVVSSLGVHSATFRAGRNGTFTRAFPGVPLARCGGLFARATGSKGSDAVLKIPRPACIVE